MSYEDLRYNEVRQKSVHNAFQRSEGIYDQILYWRVRSLEIDLHRTHPFGGFVDDDWFVYHGLLDPFSTVYKFSELLQICAGVHRAVPGHEVITLFLDIKDGFPPRTPDNRSWELFDAMLDAHLGEWLYRPADLVARLDGAKSLRQAVEGAGWPLLSELRGKVLVVLTGSDEQLRNYARPKGVATERSAFLSLGIRSATDIGVDDRMVFYNMDDEHVLLARQVRAQGFVSRGYYIDDRVRWNRAVRSGCHHIATDMVNAREDTWSTTSGPTGFPFTTLSGPTPRELEPGTVGGIWARSGDIWNCEDSFLFHHKRFGAGEIDNEYVFAVSGPNSHTDDWVKGCVMARQTLAAGSPYLGVFRVGEQHGLRVQIRPSANAPTAVLERHIGPTWRFGSDFEQDTLVYVKLQVSDSGRNVSGSGSVDGSDWVELGAHRFDQPLALQGLGVSSHGQGRGAKFLFVVPDGGDQPGFDTTTRIGTRGDPATGWVDWAGSRRWRTTRFSR